MLTDKKMWIVAAHRLDLGGGESLFEESVDPEGEADWRVGICCLTEVGGENGVPWTDGSDLLHDLRYCCVGVVVIANDRALLEVSTEFGDGSLSVNRPPETGVSDHALDSALPGRSNERDAFLDTDVSGCQHRVVLGYQVEDVVNDGQQLSGIVQQLDGFLRAEVPARAMRAPMDRVKGRHPNDLRAQLERDAQRLGIEPSDAVIKGDAAEDVERGEFVLQRPGNRLCGIFVTFENDAGHSTRLCGPGELPRVHAAFGVRVGAGMDVDVDRAFEQRQRVVGRLDGC